MTMCDEKSETAKLVERAFALPRDGGDAELEDVLADPPPIDYRTAYGALMEMTQELRALVIAADELHDRHERGALAAVADHVEAMAKLYADTLRLMANPPVV